MTPYLEVRKIILRDVAVGGDLDLHIRRGDLAHLDSRRGGVVLARRPQKFLLVGLNLRMGVLRIICFLSRETCLCGMHKTSLIDSVHDSM